MEGLLEISGSSLQRIRKTAETPQRVSVYDVIRAVTGLTNNNCANVWKRLQENHPEASTGCRSYRFRGRGQQETPAADARTICEIIMLLPGTAAASFRKKTAAILVRYLGGDDALVDEIAANRLAQENLPHSHPMRFFGEAVEAEAVKRKREQVELAELGLRLAELETRVAEQRSHVKRARVEAVEMGLQALQRLNLPIDDRDRARAKDIINTATFLFDDESVSRATRPDDKEICIRSFLQARNIRDTTMDARLGRVAKQLWLQDNPEFEFRKKTIYCNGQMVLANVWTESMQPYLEKALDRLREQTVQADVVSLLCARSV